MDQFGSFVRVEDYEDEVDASKVCTLSLAQKQHLLGPDLARQSSRVRAILERLSDIYPALASVFSAKADRLEDLAFRLIPSPVDHGAENPLSYIALSYCWKQSGPETVTHRHAQASSGNCVLPISRRLFGALLAELRPFEGLC
ncbi:hypothetical protein MMC13_004882 [Lambiella insularis]|nr:hypothetical protein [Lambiella insularis]